MQNDIADSTKFLCGDFRLNMWIPSDIAGKVIGKKGVVISNMQRETGCKLISACPPVGNSLWVCVTMIGEPAATTKVLNALALPPFLPSLILTKQTIKQIKTT